MLTSRLVVALSLGAGLSLGQIAVTQFDCAAVGALPAIGGAANCDGCTGTPLATVSATAECGFPTTGAQYGRVAGNGSIPALPFGATMPRPAGATLSELRIALPASATGVMLDWEFFQNEPGASQSTFNDGMNIAVVDAAGNYLQSLVQADTATPQPAGGCANTFGLSVLAAGPQAFSSTLVWPRPAGSYLSVVCYNGTDTAIDPLVSIDNVRFVSGNDDCANAIPIGEGTIVWTNNGATPVAANTNCFTTLSRDVWFSYTNPHACNETIILDTCPTPGEPAPVLNDTILRIYDACGGPCLVGNDDANCGPGTGLRSRVTFVVPAGATRLIAVGSYNMNIGNTWSLTLNATNATKAIVGTGCGSPAPTLDSNVPILGGNYTWTIASGTPGANGWLLYGPQAGPTNLGGTCNLYLSNSGLNFLFPVATDAVGGWTVTIGLPGDPSLDCLSVGFQAFLGSTNGINLTNGLHVTLGF